MTTDLTPERWRRISGVLDEALELSAAERGAFLDRACQGDAALRSRVEALLAAGERAGQFLETPAVAVEGWRSLLGDRAESPVDPAPGAEIGSYRIVREIGRGGMGVVYLARRAEGGFEQQLALKVIRRGMDSEEILRRFLRERQILARLRHENVASLLDGGISEDGRPWFAMEHVEGEPITAWCERKRSSVETRLRLFRLVCNGVQHAHQNLVIHRDLKPSNVLVTPEGGVKLLDFGIAKLLESESNEPTPTMTEAGLRFLTPEYAAPEQVRGEAATTATDVYGLGIILYELLTGRRPYEVVGRSREEIDRTVLGTQPPSPSAAVDEESAQGRATSLPRLRRGLRGDLDTIVMAALRKEPERRYPTAEALGREIGRHLRGEPITARADTLGYRAGKFITRHRWGVTAAGLILISVFAGFAGIVWKAREAAEEADRAGTIKDFVLSIFEASDPSVALGENASARDLLDRGARRIETDLSSQPELQAEMLGVVGELYRKLGSFDRAGELLERSLQRKRVLFGERHPETAEALARWGVLLWERGDYEEAARVLDDALALRRETLGTGDPKVGESLSALASVYSDLGDPERAEAAHREALAIDRAYHGDEHPSVATDLSNLAIVLWEQGRYEEAEPLHREALAMRRRIHGQEHPQVAHSLHALATFLSDAGRLDEAEGVFEEALAMRRRLLGNDHPDVAVTLANLGILMERRGDRRAAKAYEEEALALRLRALGEGHPDLATSYNNLGVLSYRLRDFADAERYFGQALTIWVRELGEDHPNVASGVNNRGMVLRELGDLAAAEDLVRQGLRIRRKLLGDEHSTVAQSYRNLGLIQTDRGFHAQAEQSFRRSLAISRAAYPEDHWRIGEVLTGYGRLLLEEGRPSDAEPLLRQADAICSAALGDSHLRTGEARLQLGMALAALERAAEARPLLESAVAIGLQGGGEAHPLTLEARRRLRDLPGG